MSTSIATPAALLFTQEELGGPCLEQDSTVNCLGTATSLCNGNGDRVGLIIFNFGNNPIWVALDVPLVNATQGIELAANGGFISMNVRDDFTLPSRQWWGAGNGSASTCYILEIIRFTVTQGSS